MIFATVGTHPQPFDRLFIELDRLVEDGKIRETVFGQKGCTKYEPKNFECKKALNAREHCRAIKKARIVVSHGGAGSIINALASRKPLIIVPRLKKFCEHTNDHQLDLAAALEKKGKCVAVKNIKELGRAIKKARPAKSAERENKKMAHTIREFILQARN